MINTHQLELNPSLAHIFMVPNVFEPLKFYWIKYYMYFSGVCSFSLSFLSATVLTGKTGQSIKFLFSVACCNMKHIFNSHSSKFPFQFVSSL